MREKLLNLLMNDFLRCHSTFTLGKNNVVLSRLYHFGLKSSNGSTVRTDSNGSSRVLKGPKGSRKVQRV